MEVMKGERVLYKDMVDMEVLNDAELSKNMRERFIQDDYMTYIGPTLLVVNPYKFVGRYFTDEVRKELEVNSFNPKF